MNQAKIGNIAENSKTHPSKLQIHLNRVVRERYWAIQAASFLNQNELQQLHNVIKKHSQINK